MTRSTRPYSEQHAIGAQTRHRAILSAYIAQHPNVVTRGFMRAISKIIGVSDPSYLGYMIVPDAYAVHEDEQELVAIEVEDTSRLTPAKMSYYIDLWWALDDVDWRFALVTVDRNGKTAKVDLFAIPLLQASA